MCFYEFARCVVKVFLKIAYHITFEGVEHIPDQGGYLLCCNHRTYMDPLFVGLKVPQALKFMAKEELFEVPVLKHVIKKLGAFPVARGKGDSGAVDFAVETVKSGQVLALFPEGTRSKDGTLGKVKSGALVIAAQTKAMIVPAVILFEGKLKFRSKVTVRYGEPIAYESLPLKEITPQNLKAAKHLLAGRLQQLMEE